MADSDYESSPTQASGRQTAEAILTQPQIPSGELTPDVSKRSKVLQDLKTGCLVSTVAAKYDITKRQVRRWRFEHNRVKNRMDKAVEAVMQAAAALRLTDNSPPNPFNTAFTVPSGRKRYIEKRISDPHNLSLASSTNSTDRRTMETPPKRRKLRRKVANNLRRKSV